MDVDLTRERYSLLAGIILSTAICSYIVGYYDYPLYSSAQSILTTLVGIQASIFAIVFSVVILGVRLAASRYSPRLASSFKEDADFHWAVGIFGVSIGVNIIGLYLAGAVGPHLLSVLVLLSGILLVGAFWTLYIFVNRTLERTTPEGILTHIQDRMGVPYLVEQAEKSAEDPTERDPFLVLVSVIDSTIAEKDRASASLGLDVLEDRVIALLTEASEDEFEEDSPIDDSLERLCGDQLPNITEEAVNKELVTTAEEVSETAESIGETASAEELDTIVEYVVRGQVELIDNVQFDSTGERVRRNAIDTADTVLKDAAEEGVWEGAAVGARLLGWISAASIMMRDGDEAIDHRYTSLLILVFPKLLKNVVGTDEDLSVPSGTGWLRNFRDRLPPRIMLLSSCYGSQAELTSAAVRYEIHTEQRVFDWESVAAGWSNAVETLIDAGLESMAKQWFGTILYLEYIQSQTSDDVMDGFSPNIIHRVSREFAIDTKEKIQNSSIEPRTRIDLIPGGPDPVELPLTGANSPPVTSTETSFSDWLDSREPIFRMSGGFGHPIDLDHDDSEE